MLIVVGMALGKDTELLGEVTNKEDASSRCYQAAAVYAVFFMASVLLIRFGPGDGPGGKRLAF